MAPIPFLDTNVLLRHLRQDVAHQSPRATAYLSRIERGELTVRTSDTVIFETVFTLERTYKQPRASIRAALLPVLRLPSIVLPGKRRLRQVFDLYIQYPKLSFADCYHVALVEGLRLSSIVSFDRDYDQVPGLTREEP
jgi:predicted nucleic acid-binding protein